MALIAMIVITLVIVCVLEAKRRRSEQRARAIARRLAANRRLADLLSGVAAPPRTEPAEESYEQYRERRGRP